MINSSLLGGYYDRRMFRIFLIGMISGFPWVLIGSALTLWLKEAGQSLTLIGFVGLIFVPYSVNFLWAPLLDKIKIPFLAVMVGPRKAWILFFQLIIMLAVVGWTIHTPAENLKIIVGLGLVISIASASQDIIIDAFRIEQVDRSEEDKMAAGAAIAIIGYLSGFKLGGLIMLYVADFFEAAGYAQYWQASFLVIIGLMIVMNIGLVLIPEKPATKDKGQSNQELGGFGPAFQWIKETYFNPFASFFRANGTKIAIALLSFVFLFKIGEAFLGKMSIVFYRDIGFSKSDIALFSKGLGWLTTVGFTLIGGLVAAQFGSVRALFYAGIAMASTNLMFTLLAWTGDSIVIFALAVLLDDLAAAFATVAFVAFISILVDRRYTATQYALLASIGTLGRTLLASGSGLLVDVLGGDWGLFFIITAVMVTPSLILLWYMRDIFAKR
jgi:PAT family beta-lactamase induction signal transducer AmpG